MQLGFWVQNYSLEVILGPNNLFEVIWGQDCLLEVI